MIVAGYAVFYSQNRRRRLGIFEKNGILTHTQPSSFFHDHTMHKRVLVFFLFCH
jgi:hypothetical protein